MVILCGLRRRLGIFEYLRDIFLNKISVGVNIEVVFVLKMKGYMGSRLIAPHILSVGIMWE
jgi:hypothetical protein